MPESPQPRQTTLCSSLRACSSNSPPIRIPLLHIFVSIREDGLVPIAGVSDIGGADIERTTIVVAEDARNGAIVFIHRNGVSNNTAHRDALNTVSTTL
jgi:hypothetical protein